MRRCSVMNKSTKSVHKHKNWTIFKKVRCTVSGSCSKSHAYTAASRCFTSMSEQPALFSSVLSVQLTLKGQTELKPRAQKPKQFFWGLLCLLIIAHASFFLKGINEHFKNEKNPEKSSHGHINTSIITTYKYSQANKCGKHIWKQHNKISRD